MKLEHNKGKQSSVTVVLDGQSPNSNTATEIQIIEQDTVVVLRDKTTCLVLGVFNTFYNNWVLIDECSKMTVYPSGSLCLPAIPPFGYKRG